MWDRVSVVYSIDGFGRISYKIFTAYPFSVGGTKPVAEKFAQLIQGNVKRDLPYLSNVTDLQEEDWVFIS